jgi:hypothetical protein
MTERRIWSDNPNFAPVSNKAALCVAIKNGKRKPPRPLRRQARPAHLDLIDDWTPGKNWELEP